MSQTQGKRTEARSEYYRVAVKKSSVALGSSEGYVTCGVHIDADPNHAAQFESWGEADYARDSYLTAVNSATGLKRPSYEAWIEVVSTITTVERFPYGRSSGEKEERAHREHEAELSDIARTGVGVTLRHGN